MTDVAPIKNAIHLCIDMQNIFAKGGSGKHHGWTASCH